MVDGRLLDVDRGDDDLDARPGVPIGGSVAHPEMITMSRSPLGWVCASVSGTDYRPRRSVYKAGTHVEMIRVAYFDRSFVFLNARGADEWARICWPRFVP